MITKHDPFKTNQMSLTRDNEALDKEYDFFVIKKDSGYITKGAYTIDSPSVCNGIQSTYFDYGSCFYAMLLKGSTTQHQLIDVLRNTEDGDSLTVRSVRAADLEDYVLSGLSLTALGSMKLPALRCNNLTGHLYVVLPEHTKVDPKTGDVIRIAALEIAVSRGMKLFLRVHTFTSMARLKALHINDEELKSLPKYQLVAPSVLKRIPRGKNGSLSAVKQDSTIFVQRQYEGVKYSEYSYWEMTDPQSGKSKLHALHYVLKMYEEKYHGMLKFEFESIEDYTAYPARRGDIDDTFQITRNHLLETDIRIVDQIGTEESKRVCDGLADLLQDGYDIKRPSIDTHPRKRNINICLLHEKAFYQESADVYKGVPAIENTVQHITIEKFSEAKVLKGQEKLQEKLQQGKPKRTSPKTYATQKANCSEISKQLYKVIQDALIKQDIHNGKITLFDWSSLNLNEPIEFTVYRKIDDIEYICTMTIEPDGSFVMANHELLDMPVQDYIDLYLQKKQPWEGKIKGTIRYPNGDINIIRESFLRTIPESDVMIDRMAAGTPPNVFRRQAEIPSVMEALVDIKFFDRPDGSYYMVGERRSTINQTVRDAPNIRQVQGWNNAPVRFVDLLALMNVSFVRSNQLTVYPFPMKYLDEYCQMWFGSDTTNGQVLDKQE